MWDELRHILRSFVKLAGLTIVAVIALCISVLINYTALACTQMEMRLLIPGFNLLLPAHSLLAPLTHFLRISGS